MATPILLRATVLLRTRLHRHRLVAVTLLTPPRRKFTTAPESTTLSSVFSSSPNNSTVDFSAKNSPKLHDLELNEWKDKETDILRDVQPIVDLAKEILHTERYMHGEQLTTEDEKFVMDNLLAYHPHCEDKIGCGLDSIIVDRHPIFKHTRCLFVVRTDGGLIDFSYRKCLRSYIEEKYPSYAERFIQAYFKPKYGFHGTRKDQATDE